MVILFFFFHTSNLFYFNNDINTYRAHARRARVDAPAVSFNAKSFASNERAIVYECYAKTVRNRQTANDLFLRSIHTRPRCRIAVDH